jgi:hypothetical protein
MKKGLLTLVVVLMTLVGVVANAAVPGMWGIPDVIIGDLEDTPPDGAATDYLFVYPDAFDLDNYMSIVSSGTLAGLTWHYMLGDPDPTVIAINGTTPAPSTDIYAVDNLVDFRNVACSPVGAHYSLHPIGFPTTTPIVCTLKIQNTVGASSYSDEGSFTVYTVHGVNDSLTNEFYRVDRVAVSMASDPTGAGWSFVGIEAPVGPGSPYGITPPDYGYDATTGAVYLMTDGADNNVGMWVMPTGTGAPIPYIDGAAYIVESMLFAEPTHDQGSATADHIPGIRVRANVANESVNVALDIKSYQFGGKEVSMDSSAPSTETFIIDPRDQSGWTGVGLEDLYYAFDLIDFPVGGGADDEEGIVALTNVDIDSFPIKMMVSTLADPQIQTVYPAGTSFAATYESDFTHVDFGFGGTAPSAFLDASGNLAVSASGSVTRGLGYHELVETAGFIMNTSGLWHQIVFSCKASTQMAPWMRLRVFMSDFQRTISNSYLLIGTDGSQLPPGAGADYSVFFVPQDHYGSGVVLCWGFDYIDFDVTYGEAILSCSKVTCKTFNPPLPAP